jgi:hypothetical protein
MALPCILSSVILLASEPAFRFQREIRPSGPGPQRLEPDLIFLGGVDSGFRDLRIKGSDGREVPYVIVPPATSEASWLPGRMLPLPATKTSSGLELDLGGAVRTSRLRLEGLQAPFLKRFRLEASGDRARWTELVEEGSLFDLPEDGLKLLHVDLPEGEYRYLRLVWDDASSGRIALPRGAFVQVREPGAAPPMVKLAFQRASSEPGISRFSLRLPGLRLPITALRLVVGGRGPLLRDARIMEGRLQAGGLSPRDLGQAQLRRTERLGVAASDLRIPMETPEGSELELRVEDGSNPPIDLQAVMAEWQPQPWIYFESDGKPALALYGNSRIEAPRYDLEALKDQIRPGTARPAQWGALAAPVAASQEGKALQDPGPGADLDPAGFRVRRSIPDAEPGLAALVLDAPVLAASKSLQDLRILDGQRRQIPYLLEQRDGPLTVPLAWPERQARGRASAYVLDLTQQGLTEGRVVLETRTRVFRRRVRLREEGSPEQEGRLLSESLWSHDQPDTDPPLLILGFSQVEGSRVVVTVDEGDNQALPVARARLLLPGWRLRFFHPGRGLTLCYDRDLESPQYDLALLADRLRAAPALELEMSGAGLAPLPAARTGTPMGATRLFWGVLAGVVVALFVMLAVLLRKPEEGQKEGG